MSDELVQKWRDLGKPQLPVGSPAAPDAEIIMDLEQFIAAGPGPLPMHQKNYGLALERVREQLEWRE